MKNVKEVDTAVDVSRPIYLVAKGPATPGVKKLVDFIATEGSKYVKK